MTVANRATVGFTSGFQRLEAAVLRNEAGATVLFSAGDGLTGNGRLENAVLILRGAVAEGDAALVVLQRGREPRMRAGTGDCLAFRAICRSADPGRSEISDD